MAPMLVSYLGEFFWIPAPFVLAVLVSGGKMDTKMGFCVDQKIKTKMKCICSNEVHFNVGFLQLGPDLVDA